MRGTSVRAALVVGVLASAIPPAARAEERSAALSWVRLPGAEGCIDATELAERIEAHLARTVFVPPTRADLSVEGRVEPRPGGGFRLAFRVGDREGGLLGERSLEDAGPDCRRLDERAILVIALAIDPDAAMRDRDAIPSKEARPAAPPPAATSPTPPERVVVRDRLVPVVVPRGDDASGGPWQFEGRLASTVTVATLPGATPGLLLAASVDPPTLPALEVGGVAWLERDVEAGTGGGRFTALGGRVAVCPSIDLSRWTRVAGCGGVELLALHGEGYGYAKPVDTTEPIVSVLATGGLVVGSGRLFGRVGVGGMLSVARAKFTYTQADGAKRDLLAMPPVGLLGELGLGFRFSSHKSGAVEP